ncbi:OmpH family outer membrane protein [Sphingomonas sp.]|jgi:Skp family chaperone for outer membrane proteins|uniref:OmpH family outer membrane protein n=1 Tax=Sphingomonas sp. TaxID=28214 RepID=UPI002E31F3A6|nr:OmpH family outer membrane protein [Sphingomonas sp.]HEX4693772.1 OmpH family outer membrane protein [Sphingomonas sp.]
MTNKKLIGAAIAAAALVAPAVALAQTAPSVLVVDIDRVGSECNACKVAGGQFQTMVQQAQTRAQTLRTQLETAGAPLEASIKALNGKAPDVALQARVTAFQQQENSANGELNNTQQRLQSIQQNINRQILEKLGPITDALLRQRGALIVMARNSTLANADSVDITNDVLAQINAQLPSISVTPMPQAAPAPGATAPAPTVPAPTPTTPRRGR